jgi:hypothetical protein
MKDIQKIADALTAVIRLIVDKPDKMSLTIVPDGSGWMFRVSVSPSDRNADWEARAHGTVIADRPHCNQYENKAKN